MFLLKEQFFFIPVPLTQLMRDTIPLAADRKCLLSNFRHFKVRRDRPGQICHSVRPFPWSWRVRRITQRTVKNYSSIIPLPFALESAQNSKTVKTFPTWIVHLLICKTAVITLLNSKNRVLYMYKRAVVEKINNLFFFFLSSFFLSVLCPSLQYTRSPSSDSNPGPFSLHHYFSA